MNILMELEVIQRDSLLTLLHFKNNFLFRKFVELLIDIFFISRKYSKTEADCCSRHRKLIKKKN